MAGQTATTSGGLSTAFTPAYGAPEQWAPKRFGKTGPWTDVWGLALTFVEALAGREVITGDHVAMMGTVLDEKRRPTPRSEGAAVPAALELVFRRALAVDPRERHRDAGAFWDEVEQALGLPRSAPPISRPGRLDSRASVSPAARRSHAPSRPPPPLDLAGVGMTIPADPGPLARGAVISGARSFHPGQPTEPVLPLALDWSSPALGARPSYAPPRMPPPMDARPREAVGAADLMAMFGLPVRLAGAGVLVTIADLGAASLLFDGQRIGIGPLRLLHVAVALVVVGIGVAVFRLFASNR
jgi:serine/threonine-protein kinase